MSANVGLLQSVARDALCRSAGYCGSAFQDVNSLRSLAVTQKVAPTALLRAWVCTWRAWTRVAVAVLTLQVLLGTPGPVFCSQRGKELDSRKSLSSDGRRPAPSFRPPGRTSSHRGSLSTPSPQVSRGVKGSSGGLVEPQDSPCAELRLVALLKDRDTAKLQSFTDAARRRLGKSRSLEGGHFTFPSPLTKFQGPRNIMLDSVTFRDWGRNRYRPGSIAGLLKLSDPPESKASSGTRESAEPSSEAPPPPSHSGRETQSASPD